MDKFLLAMNEMSGNDDVVIVRAVQPVSHYQVVDGHVGSRQIHKHFTYKNSEGEKELYTLVVTHYFTTDIDTTDESEVYKFMDDAWHWYMAYLKWEDEQIDNSLL